MSTPPPIGQVFTPPRFAQALVDAAHEFCAANGVAPERIVEPAAGAGALLAPLRRRFPSARIWALELDATLAGTLRTEPATSTRVVHADTLTLSRGARAPASAFGIAHGALAPAALDPEDALLLRTDWADLIVANPPYLRETGNAPVFRALRTWHDGALAAQYRKDADLHQFFWDVAMRWLRPGGVLAMLTPAYFWDADAARPLRARLATEGRVCALWRAGDARVFHGAGVEAAVTVWRKGTDDEAGPPVALDASLKPTDRRIPVCPSGAPWRWYAPPRLERPPVPTIGEVFHVIEGVSTGANRLLARDVSRVRDGCAGEPITVFRGTELAAMGLEATTVARYLRRRWRADATEEWVLLLRDDDTWDTLDDPALRAHLQRFRAVLAGRAEFRRNASRPWHVAAWPRQRIEQPALVTPKWSSHAAFAVLPPDRVAMTDCRVLVPRSWEADLGAWLAYLNGPVAAPWFSATLKRKGGLLEFYGGALAAVPGPHASPPP